MTQPGWPSGTPFDRIADPGWRIKAIETTSLERGGEQVDRLDVSFGYIDMRGTDAVATGRIYLPPVLRTSPEAGRPLVFTAGYEVDEKIALDTARAGTVLAYPLLPADGQAWPTAHPIGRCLNLDLAFLHIARSLPCIDDARVVVRGLSAGGHKALLLAAETFPLSGVMADVPPLNWAYGVAYWRNLHHLPLGPIPAALPQTQPWLLSGPVTDLAEAMVVAIGDNFDAPPWFELSPVAHLERITCRVSTLFSTADLLVPVEQVGHGLAPPADLSLFPPGFTTDPDRLLRVDAHRVRLLDVLAPDEVELRHAAVPAGTPHIDYANMEDNVDWSQIEVEPSSARWSITLIDEGPVDPHVHHFRHAMMPDRERLTRDWLAAFLDVEQLTVAKLEMLMSRYAGREWLAPGFRHLDDAASERADVLRGLRTFTTVPEGARRFVDVYRRLASGFQALGPDVAVATPDSVPDVLRTLSEA